MAPSATRRDAIEELERRIAERQQGRPIAPPKPKTMGAYAAYHVAEREQEVTDGKITAQWLAGIKQHLDRAVAYFGPDRALPSITADDVKEWVARLPLGRAHHVAIAPRGTGVALSLTL